MGSSSEAFILAIQIHSPFISTHTPPFLLVAHRIEEADDSNIDLINEIYDYSVEHGYRFYVHDELEVTKGETL